MPSVAEMSSVVRGAYDAFNRRDVDALLQLTAEEIVVHDVPSMPGPELFRGRDGVVRFFEDMWGTFEAVWGDIEQILEAGPNRVLVLARHGATARGGPELIQHRGVVMTFAPDAKLTEIRFYEEPGEALAAVGLDKHTA